MPVRTISGRPDTVIREEYVGSSRERICYPGISSCIAITGVLQDGLVGAHITIASERDLVYEILQAMKVGGGGNCLNFYVIGAFTHFKPNATQAINTRKKIRDKIKSAINRNATVRFYDSSAHGDVHVFAEKNVVNTDFFWISSHGNNVQGFNYPAFVGRTPINAIQFVIR
jgi:hypothetical protein